MQATELAVGRYEGMQTRGDWPVVPPVDRRLRLGNRHPGVVALRKRLAVSGDLESSAGESDIFDSSVDAAVRRFQARHGITVDGIVRKAAFDRLNIPCAVRLAQLRTNVERLRKLTGHLGKRFVMTDIPAAQIEVGVAVSRHTAVVDKPDWPPPDIDSRMIEINLNPYWTAPVSIGRRYLILKMQAEPDYLTRNHIRILDQQGKELTPLQINWYSDEAVNYLFKQDPSDFNSLGSIRINFPSKDGVYMLDTPLKNLFGKDMRFHHSSGCVRVQNARELVSWLLRDTPDWPREKIEAAIASGGRVDAKLAAPVPVHWVYITGWATPDAVVQVTATTRADLATIPAN